MNNVSYELICKKYYGKVKKISKAFAKSTGIDETEIQSLLNEELFIALRDFDSERSNDISKWLNQRLKSRVINFIKSRYATEVKRWIYYESRFENDEGEEDTYNIFEPRSCTNIEEDYIYEENKKTNADKRQLISELVENSDSVTTAIVNEYLNWTSSERLTPTAIGRKLGIHHEIVKRRLNKLAKRYDERQFGSIEAYLAV